MSEDFGPGVSRTLSAYQRQFLQVIWQEQKPPLDSELNLGAQVSQELLETLSRSSMHSGFLIDPMKSVEDFITSKSYSNRFKLGRPASDVEEPILWANVKGWLVPVCGTLAEDGDVSNVVNLFPPPASDARIDLVFLEVWQARIASNPSTINKPSQSSIWKWGNVLFGGTNITDDLEDPTIGFETTERVQLQYRIRVFGSGAGLGQSVSLSVYPEGLDDPNVLAQGTSTSPVAGYTWTNMRGVLNDPGLWRSGDGDPENDLGTVDGYSYAIPIAAVFRRNTQPFVARTDSGNANQNGALNRNPPAIAITNPAEGAATFGTATLNQALTATTTGVVNVSSLAGSGFDNSELDWDAVFITLGDEIVHLTSVNEGGNTITIAVGSGSSAGRGRFGTQAVPHAIGTELKFYCFRPDGMFADEISPSDIHDLRHAVTSGEWDYNQLLTHNLGKLFSGELRSSYKQSGISDTEGCVVVEIDTLNADSGTPIPNQTESLDGPDGIRTIFSDAAVVQSGVTVILNPETGSPGDPVAVSDFTAGAPIWEVAADFVPSGFQVDGGGWNNGTVINLYIGGADGSSGARETSRSGQRFMRFVSPKEYWLSGDVSETGNRTPFRIRFTGTTDDPAEGGFTEPATTGESSTLHPGPMYPLPQFNFERPFIVLGGVVNSSLRSTNAEVATTPYEEVIIPGVNFDTAGLWYPTGDIESLDASAVTNSLLYGRRTLYDMLTAGGTDTTGGSSELYVVVTGDTSGDPNNGVFKVVGAGTVGYTLQTGSVSNALRVVGVQQGWAAFTANTGLTIEVRSQYMNTEDGANASTGAAAAVVVLTDLAGVSGGTSNPWRSASLGGYALTLPSPSPIIMDTAILYGPGHSGFARVPEKLDRFAVVNPISSAYLLRQSPAVRDSNFPSQAGVPSDETYYPAQNMQVWNRLPGKGLDAPEIPAGGYGDGRGALVEQLRETELLVDNGSKTVVFRPFRKVNMSSVRRDVNTGTGDLIPAAYPNSVSVDGAGIFASGGGGYTYGYTVPPEYMPRFGRQDIPVYVNVTSPLSAAPFQFGINHLFVDSTSTSGSVFRIIGGKDNSGVAGVTSMLIQTGVTSGLDYAVYGSIPGGGNGYQGRLYQDVNVRSSDLPPGLNGIQLPPFLGLARVYGVYDLREWNGSGAWQADRITPETGGSPPKNLLKTNADKQTLFIVNGGAFDLTGNVNDHTYVIPENALDIRLSGSYISGEEFVDLEYVVECEVFGFARGFINQNNYVLARLHDGNGDLGTAVDALADSVAMVLPTAPPVVECYAAYHRPVYQGDPFMTRDGATRVVSDYENRYGQVSVANAFNAGIPIQQYSAAGEQIPEIPNARSLEILAVMDFYTTLGTGKMSGYIYPGTPTDVAHLEESVTRLPATNTSNQFQPEVRTFTEGQTTSPHARLNATLLYSATVTAGDTVVISYGDLSVSLESGVDFDDSPGNTVISTAKNLAAAINSNVTLKNLIGLRAEYNEGSVDVTFVAALPGKIGNSIKIGFNPVSGFNWLRFNTSPKIGDVFSSVFRTRSYLTGGEDVPVNGTRLPIAVTPGKLTGLTERLPLGILLSDFDFLGEDPLRNGSSVLSVKPSGGGQGATRSSPQKDGQEYTRLEGLGQLGLADGSILAYTGYNAVDAPTGVRAFRLNRGGGSAYVLSGAPDLTGGPVDWQVAGFDPATMPVLKGALLAGRAYLVRNYKETAFTLNQTVSHGDEIQMVIITRGILGEGIENREGYAIDGQISPTGYGEGYCAADRYRLEGKPLHPGTSSIGTSPDVSLAPYPTEDPADVNPC